MTEPEPMVECASCGTSAPRADMFGVEPDLLCPRCASGVRRRLHVRFRPRPRDRAPHATVACLAVAASLFVATHLVWAPAPGKPVPGWLLALYQDNTIWLGAVWKHVTSMFLHGGILHILLNGGALWTLGRIVEGRWGSLAMLGLLLGTGAAGSATEFMMQERGAVGLSGGLFGLCGFLIALRKSDPVAGAIMHDGNVRYVLGFGVACVVVSTLGLLPIANWAHGAGLVTGWLFGRALLHPRRVLLASATAALCVALVAASVFLAFGDVQLSPGSGGESVTWPRQKWRTYWIERHAGP